jgi:hypothetical protein
MLRAGRVDIGPKEIIGMERLLSMLLAAIPIASAVMPQDRIEALPATAFHAVSYV